MGTKNNPGKFDCFSKAEPDEPVFVLLGRDPLAAALVEFWATAREQIGEDPEKVAEARACADAMAAWARRKGKRPLQDKHLLAALVERRGVLEELALLNKLTDYDPHLMGNLSAFFESWLCHDPLRDTGGSGDPARISDVMEVAAIFRTAIRRHIEQAKPAKPCEVLPSGPDRECGNPAHDFTQGFPMCPECVEAYKKEGLYEQPDVLDKALQAWRQHLTEVELSDRLDGEPGHPMLDKLDEFLITVRPELFSDPDEGLAKEEVPG